MTARAGLRYAMILAMLGSVMAGCRIQSQAKSAPAAAAGQEKIFPGFTVKTLDDKSVSLNQYRGKIVILDLFATWCPPCKMEIPHFVELQKEHAGKVAVVGLSYDQAPVADLKKFMKEMKINYDVHRGNEEIAQHVGLRGIPHTLVLDPQGRVYRSYVGYREKSVFEKDIQALSAKFPTQPLQGHGTTKTAK